MEKLYCKLLVWAIMKLVNKHKTFQERCDKLNRIINWLIDVYADYKKEGKTC